MPGDRAEPEAIDLRKHVPHPVGALTARPDLGKRALVFLLLRLDESVQVVWLIHECEPSRFATERCPNVTKVERVVLGDLVEFFAQGSDSSNAVHEGEMTVRLVTEPRQVNDCASHRGKDV